MNTRIFLTIGGIVLAVCAAWVIRWSERDGEASVSCIPFRVIDDGPLSSLVDREPASRRQVLVASDDRSWATLWHSHTQGRFPTEPVPAVDFERETVIGVFLGFGEGGTVKIQCVRISGETAVVEAAVILPSGLSLAMATQYAEVVAVRGRVRKANLVARNTKQN